MLAFTARPDPQQPEGEQKPTEHSDEGSSKIILKGHKVNTLLTVMLQCTEKYLISLPVYMCVVDMCVIMTFESVLGWILICKVLNDVDMVVGDLCKY